MLFDDSIEFCSDNSAVTLIFHRGKPVYILQPDEIQKLKLFKSSIYINADILKLSTETSRALWWGAIAC